ncbi:protein with phosphotransacetylase BioD-like N-terminal domain [Xenococcus sp. PCC 7305]|uniref:phosphotransacetylase family protein n=1 Tax=Xenococcus sp. PCC 7305 TaxID=102125 RepID=UPI0002AC7DE8|nr:phosphotransacetylase family protein [Xenococcus sp. PCC 7305]ELS05209.1 protein with phosphotransacetylase BioD-like N-terminal domain [Xenococcus sp. PCC 7305]
MAKPAKYLLIGSIEAYSGKSATVLGITHHLNEQGIQVAYGKPLGTCLSTNPVELVEKDIRFVSDILGLSSEKIHPTLLNLDRDTITRRLLGKDTQDYAQALQEYIQSIEGELALLEGASSLWEGSLFNLSIPEIAKAVDGSILLVTRYSSISLVASLLTAKQFLGDRLLGITINDVPPEDWEDVQNLIVPYLEKQNIPVLAVLPKDRLLNSVSVRELARRLEAKILCRGDRLDLMVESLSIGAMNVNSALEYFRQRENMVVVTGGDRTELQMAALETSTNCLIVTGNVTPKPLILNRAEDLEIPILAVDSDTLTTVEIVDAAFGKVPIREPIKVQQIRELMKQYFDFDRLSAALGLVPLPGSK